MSGSYAPCLRLVTLVACTTDPRPGELISATIRYGTTTSSHKSHLSQLHDIPCSQTQRFGAPEPRRWGDWQSSGARRKVVGATRLYVGWIQSKGVHGEIHKERTQQNKRRR